MVHSSASCPLTAMSVPEGAACWICLDEGPDVHGRPLVRDCSCRGDNAGFAHLSCLAQYSGQKTAENVKKGLKNLDGFSQPWTTCFNCRQRYRGQLSLDMSNAFVLFAKKNYDYPGNDGNDKMKVMDALHCKIERYVDIMVKNPNNKSMEKIVESDINEMIDRVEHLKKTACMASWIHQPRKSDKYQSYMVLRGNYEAFAYLCLGTLYSMRNTNDDLRIAIKHHGRALTINKILDQKDQVGILKRQITNINLKIKGDYGEVDRDVDAHILLLKSNYKYAKKDSGECSEETLQIGLAYASALKERKHCGIKAERLMIKLTVLSRQIHGPEHELTKYAEVELEKCKVRLIMLPSFPPEIEDYQVMRYEGSQATCVVNGPITMPRNLKAEQTSIISSSGIIPHLGCPVTCYGLKNAPGLNGKLGDVRRISLKGEVRCAVHFEDESLKAVLVKPENLLVVIELPEKEIKTS